MTNPNNAVGTNAAYGGRTSVNAFNDDLTIYSRGILSGWACSPKSGMTVQIGGNGADRDAAVAEDNAGNKTSINNISGSPIDVTIPAAPATNNRIDLIVAYADSPPSGTSTVVDNPAACGIIVVSGTAAASPTAPTDATIRSAITADGATGSTAYYVILAQIRVGTGVTTIGSGVITQGDVVKSYATAGDDTVTTDSIADGAVTSDKIDYATLPCITIKGTGITQNALGKLPFTTVAYSQGTGLSLSSNGILIGAGITHVVVSASCYFSHNYGSTYAWCRLDINGLTTGNASIAENSSYGSVDFPAVDLEVNEGDIISIWSNETGQNFWGANSWLRVSVI